MRAVDTVFCLMQTAVQGLQARGILVIASAGNDGLSTDSQAHIPSSLPVANVISVAAIDKPPVLSVLRVLSNELQLSLWSGSNYGTHTVHIAAPGVQVPEAVCPYMYARSSTGPSYSGMPACV